MSAHVALEQIAAALGKHRTSVLRRAERECWMHSVETAHGTRRKLYPVLPLPPDVRTAVMAHLAKLEAPRAEAFAAGKAQAARIGLGAVMQDKAAEAARQAGLARFAGLPPESQRRAEARAALVHLATAYLKASGHPKRRGLELFAHQYGTGVIEVPDWIRTARPSVSANSILNWEQQLQAAGLARLAGRHGEHRKGTGIIDSNPELHDLVLGMLYQHPHCTAKHVMRAIRARFADPAQQPGYRTLQRWMAAWAANNKQLAAAVASPDDWRSRYQAAGGSRSAEIVRLNQRWEMDSTKGDLLLSDGTRHVIVGCIDVYSRRLKLQVSRSSSSAAVASTLRRALIDWGVPEQLGTDNGSDYVSRHIDRIVAGLAIERDLAPPFTPEHKPFIERVFGTFCRDLVELLPGFVGHSVAERKAIESRRSFAQRLMRTGGSPVEIRMDAAELQAFCDTWTDRIYAVEPHRGLNGRLPLEVAAAWREPVRRIGDERALDVLLAPAAGSDGLRQVTKKGIRLDNAWFEASELGGSEGEPVRVLLDEADIGRIYVFRVTPDGSEPFLCMAECPERTGISRAQLATARRQHQKRVLADAKAALREAAKSAGTDTIVSEILAQKADAPAIVPFPAPAVTHATGALDEAGRAARWTEPPPAPPVGADEAAKLADLEAEMARSAEIASLPSQDSVAARFRRALQITQMLNEGQAVRTADKWWVESYVTTPEYRSVQSLWLEWGETALASL